MTWDRALPGRYVDLIRDGIRPADLRRDGDKAVRSALVKTAMAAQLRGWDSMEWAYLVTDARSNLGNQLRVKGGRKTRSRKDVQDALDSAWDYAWEQRTLSPAWDREEVRGRVLGRVATASELAADADNDLTDQERAVLAYAADRSRERPTCLQVALPRQQLLEGTGLGLTALRTALARLEAKGLIRLAERGRPGGARTKERRANLYALPERDALPQEYRGTRPVVPRRHTCGAPAETTSGAPALPVVPPADDARPTKKESNMSAATLTLTLTPEEQTAVLETLRRVRHADQAPTTEDAQVIPMERRTQ